MASVLTFVQANWILLCWIACEVMSVIPGIQSSSIGTLIYGTLKGLLGSTPPPPLK